MLVIFALIRKDLDYIVFQDGHLKTKRYIFLIEKFEKLKKEERINNRKRNLANKKYDVDIEDEFDYKYSRKISKSQTKIINTKNRAKKSLKFKNEQNSSDNLKKTSNVKPNYETKKNTKPKKKKINF